MIDLKKFGAEPMTGAARDCLHSMFMNGPLWDGNVPSKTGRNWLHDKGYADRSGGFNWLTREGVLLALELGLGGKKQ